MPANHLDNTSISITLSSAPVPEAGFGRVALIVPQASNSLNGADFIIYTNADDAADDQLAGFISAATLEAVQTAFAQRPAPEDFAVVRVDLAGAETYSQARSSAMSQGLEAYGWCIDSRVAATIAAFALTIESAIDPPAVFVFSSNDASWLDAGIPAGFAAMADYENSAPIYHDDTSEWPDVAWAVNRLVYDPDEKSAPWDAPVSNVAAYTAVLSDTQKGFLKGQGNAGLPYASATFFIDPGHNMNGRPIDEIVTRDWFATRLRERVSQLKVDHSMRGEKLALTAAGQAKVQALIESLFQQGIDAGHFTEYEVVMPAITAADILAERFRATGYGVFAVSGRIFDFDFNFSTTALASA